MIISGITAGYIHSIRSTHIRTRWHI